MFLFLLFTKSQVKRRKYMANIDTIESELEDLKKQFSYLMKSAVPEMKKLNEKFSDFSENFQPQFDSIKSEVSSLKSNTSSQLSAISNDLNLFKDSIAPQVDSLQNDVSDLINNVIPELKQNSGGSEENWVTIYDKDSTDESIHWGKTSGISGEFLLSSAPSMKPYKKLRYIYVVNADKITDYFDLTYYPSQSATNLKIILPLRQPNSFVTTTMIISNITDVPKLSFSCVYKITFTHNKYPTVTEYNNSTAYYFAKIEGLLR